VSDRGGQAAVSPLIEKLGGMPIVLVDVDLRLELETPSLETQFGAERELERILGRTDETGTLAAVNPRVRPGVVAEMVRVRPASHHGLRG
jgi:hypothetical protein